MKTKSIRWQLSVSYAGIALLATLLLGAIMLMILARYFAIQETRYLIETTDDIASKAFLFSKDDMGDDGLDKVISSENELMGEELGEMLRRFSFYFNAQIRLLDAEGLVIADSGQPQSTIDIRVEDVFDKESTIQPRGFLIGRESNSRFSSWFFSIREEDLMQEQGGKGESEQRSQQVITQAFYDSDQQLLGYVELSNGPAFGREILRSVAWGWGIAALIAVLLAAGAGMWISRRFSAPLESLTQTSTQMTKGDLAVRSSVERRDEFGLLAIAFNQMAESVESKVTTLRRFVADAAHELGTPLTALRTNLELIEHEDIAVALEQVYRMDGLTQSLLDLSKLEALSTEMESETVDLAQLLEDLAEGYASRAEQAELDFNLEIGRTPIIIEGDVEQLRFMIQNLLDNAIKFTPAGGRVDVKLTQSEEEVKLSISDTGIGIPEKDVPQLFSRFHRGRNASAYPGSGLGLAIVKTIADQHGASIEVERKATGTFFKVRFFHC
jgi:signal transduction histidine kinase